VGGALVTTYILVLWRKDGTKNGIAGGMMRRERKNESPWDGPEWKNPLRKSKEGRSTL